MFLSQFYFEIQYRKGADHVNADYMSRYVLMAEEDNAEKSLDPYFNKPLEEDIRFKKHSNDISKKTKSRVERASKKYDWNGTAIIIKRDEKWLILPKPEEREKIIPFFKSQINFLEAQINFLKAKNNFLEAQINF